MDLFDQLVGATTNGMWSDANGQYTAQGGVISGGYLGTIDLTGLQMRQYSFNYNTGAAPCGDTVNVLIEPQEAVIHITACSLYHEDSICDDEGYGLTEQGENVICLQSEYCNGRPLDNNDRIIFEVRKTSDLGVISSVTLLVGQDPTTGGAIYTGTDNNWLPESSICTPGNTNFSCYLESKVMTGAALQAGICFLFLKRPFMEANGLAGDGGGEDIELRASVYSVTSTLTGPVDTAIMREGNYATILMPFLGKQLANPRPGLASLWLNGLPTAEAICSGLAFQGISYRNGSLTLPVTLIQVDLDNDAIIEDTYNDAHALLPLPPLVPPDPLLGCDFGGHSTNLVGYQIETYLLNEYAVSDSVCTSEGANIRYTLSKDFTIRVLSQYTSLVTFTGSILFTTENIFMIRCVGSELVMGFGSVCGGGVPPPSTNESQWNWSNSEPILIMRSDADIYGNYPSIVANVVTFFVNFNLSYMSASGSTSWVTEEIKIETAPGSGIFTTIAISSLPNNPGGPAAGLLPFAGGGYQESRAIVHTFATPGKYILQGHLESDAGWISTFQSWVLVGSF